MTGLLAVGGVIAVVLYAMHFAKTVTHSRANEERCESVKVVQVGGYSTDTASLQCDYEYNHRGPHRAKIGWFRRPAVWS